MSTNQTYEQGNPWRDEGKVFRGVGVVVLVIFAGFVVFDGPRFYHKHVARCRETPSRPECSSLNIDGPKPVPNLGIVLDQGTGKWAIQLEPMDQQTATQNIIRLNEAGATARLIKTTGRKKRVFYYVQLGRFKTQKDANEAGRQLNARGLLSTFTVSSYRLASQ